MAAGLLEPIAQAAEPWADAYGGSLMLQTGVVFAHFAGLLVAGGFAIATDRMALRISRDPGPRRALLLRELGAVHRPVLMGLAVVTITGVAMALADAEYLLVSPVFWLKMLAFALLLGNGLLMLRAERRLASPPAGAAPVARVGAASGAGREERQPPHPEGTGGPVETGDPVETDGTERPRDPPGRDRNEARTEPAGAVDQPASARDRDWKQLRWAAVRSMALWALTLLLGTALTAI